LPFRFVTPVPGEPRKVTSALTVPQRCFATGGVPAAADATD